MILSKVKEINEQLEAQGSRAVQKIQAGNATFYGYKPQFVIDAVNEVIEVENWHYQLRKMEILTSGEDTLNGQVVVSLEVFVRGSPESEFVTHGIQFGQCQVVDGSLGDAKKGAVTNGILKGFSLFSIGRAAYRGELEKVYKSSKRELTVVPNKKTPETHLPAQTKQDETSSLPDLPNITYDKTVEGIVIAKGDTYNNRILFKNLGFVWLPKEKGWGLLLRAA